jgi:hypothetical protein
MYSNQKFNESKKWKQLQEIINDSDDDVLEMHFTNPEQLEEKFAQLEEQNLVKINAQVDIQNNLDKIRSEYKGQQDHLEKQEQQGEDKEKQQERKIK